MPRQANSPEYVQTLEQKVAAAQRKLQLARTRLKDQERRDDARRKIIAGALALEHVERNPDSDFARHMQRLLDEYTRPDDRKLFPSLPARDAPPPLPDASG